MLSDAQIKDLWNKIQSQKDYSFTGGLRVIEQEVRNATLEEVATLFINYYEYAYFSGKKFAETVRSMKEGNDNG